MAYSLARNSRYKKFVRARNQALEEIHIRTQKTLSLQLDTAIKQIKDVLKSSYENLKTVGVYSHVGRDIVRSTEHSIVQILNPVVDRYIDLYKRMRYATYVLTYSSEAEAIGQALGQNTKYTLSKQKIYDKINSPAYAGGTIENRVKHSFNKLIRKILNSYELSAVRNYNMPYMIDNLDYVLPKPQKVSNDQRNITIGPVLKEADQKIKTDAPDMSIGFIDEETWSEALSQYLDDYVPSWRSPETYYSIKKATGETSKVYGWELEKDLTQDFVYQVRQGQVDAAKENGITDYIWIAIVDSHTDECCLWRDGLTTSEIEYALKTSHKDDDCQTIAPPAHFNCRCVLAPMTEEMPEAPKTNEKEFEDWLND